MHRSVSVSLVLLLALPAWAQAGPPAKEGPPVQPPSPAAQAAHELDDVKLRLDALEAAEESPPDVLEAVKTALGQTEVSGSIRAGYTANLADPDAKRGANDLRLSDPDHNTFNLSYAHLGVTRRVSRERDFDVGFGLDVVAGRVVEEAFDDGLLQTRGLGVGQAYVEVKTPVFGGLTIGAGKRYGWFGQESIDLSRNFHHSLSYAALSAPKTTTGLSLEIELLEGLTYTQYVSNGWDEAIDVNDAKSFGGQLQLQSGKLRAALNWIVGAERADSEGDLRWVLEANVRYGLGESTELGFLARYGEEEFDTGNERFALFQAQVRRQFLEGKVEAGLRVSFLRDQDGMITGRAQSLVETTATVEFHPISPVTIGLEYRHDESSKDGAFAGHRGQASRRGQDTLSVYFELQF